MTKEYIPRNPEKHAKWLKEPVAIIERPLRYLKDALTSQDVNEEGKMVKSISALYFVALDFAKAGDGASVKTIAKMTLANKTVST